MHSFVKSSIHFGSISNKCLKIYQYRLHTALGHWLYKICLKILIYGNIAITANDDLAIATFFLLKIYGNPIQTWVFFTPLVGQILVIFSESDNESNRTLLFFVFFCCCFFLFCVLERCLPNCRVKDIQN